jgi:hypothetical protein
MGINFFSTTITTISDTTKIEVLWEISASEISESELFMTSATACHKKCFGKR